METAAYLWVGSSPCEDCDYRAKCEQKCEDGQKWEDEYLKTINELKELYDRTLDSKR